MTKKFTFKNTVITLVIVIFIVQIVTIGYLIMTKRDLNQRVQDLQSSQQLIYNQIDSVAQQRSLQPIPGQNLLYLDTLGITVPANDTTRTIRVQSDSAPEGKSDNTEVRLTSVSMTDHSTHTQSCSDMVRLKVEPNPNPYSPDQPLYATTKLADGRTLQIYASTTKECQQAWQMMTPQQLAAPFKDARNY